MAENVVTECLGRGPHRERKGQSHGVLFCGSRQKLPGTDISFASLF